MNNLTLFLRQREGQLIVLREQLQREEAAQPGLRREGLPAVEQVNAHLDDLRQLQRNLVSARCQRGVGVCMGVISVILMGGAIDSLAHPSLYSATPLGDALAKVLLIVGFVLLPASVLLLECNARSRVRQVEDYRDRVLEIERRIRGEPEGPQEAVLELEGPQASGTNQIH